MPKILSCFVVAAASLAALFFLLANPLYAEQPFNAFPPLPDGYHYQTPASIIPTPFIHNGKGGGNITCIATTGAVDCTGDTWANGVSPGLWGRNDFHLQYSTAISVVGVVMYVESLNSEVTTILWSGYPTATNGTVQLPQQESLLVSWQSPLSVTTRFDKVQLSEKAGMRVVGQGLNHPRTVGGSKQTTYQTQIALIVVDDDPPPPDPPPIDQLPFAPNCSYVLTSTAVISTGNGTTATVQITNTQTVSSNLLLNASFESVSDVAPDSWVPSINGVVWYGSSLYLSEAITNARTGNNALVSAGNFDLEQGLGTLPPSSYLVGGFARCTHPQGCQQETAVFKWGGITAAAFGPISPTGYTLITGTAATGGGSPKFILSFSGAGAFFGNVYVDDAFIVPWDEATNTAVCRAEYYEPEEEPPDEPPPEEPPDDFPIPVNDDFSSCWDCLLPTNFLNIGQWLRWLYCRLHNFFYCSLRVWFLIIANWLLGLYGFAQSLFYWLVDTTRQWASWLLSIIRQSGDFFVLVWNRLRLGLSQFLFSLIRAVLESPPIQLLWSVATIAGRLWSIFWGWILFISDTLKALYEAILNVVQIVFGFITAVYDAWQADPLTIQELLGLPESFGRSPSAFKAALATEGPNQQKVVALFILSLAMVDNFTLDYLRPLMLALMGVLSIGVITWTLKQLQEFVPF